MLSLVLGLSVLVGGVQPVDGGTGAAPPASPVAPAGDVSARYAAAADYSARHAGRAVLMMADGKVVFERYDNGWSAATPHPLASGTKSFCGVVAACAVEDGLLSSLDERISETIAEWRSDPAKRSITVRQLLTLTSGLDPSPPGVGTVDLRDADRDAMERGGGLRVRRRARQAQEPDKFAASVNAEMVGRPGRQYAYGPSHFYVFGELMNRKLAASDRPEKTIEAYVRARVFDPIGMKGVEAMWGRDAKGNPNLPGGSRLTARGWVKFGELIRRGGTWRKEDGTVVRIVAEDRLAEMFKGTRANPAYGLTWWLPHGHAAAAAPPGEGDEEVGRGRVRDRIVRRRLDAQVEPLRTPDGGVLRVYMAAGLGGQRLYILPEQGMVIVRFAEIGGDGEGFRDAEFLRRVLGIEQPAGER